MSMEVFKALFTLLRLNPPKTPQPEGRKEVMTGKEDKRRKFSPKYSFRKKLLPE